MTEPALVLKGVYAGYGATVVLEGVDLTVAAGESVSILGRNGVGKTTLLATVMGLVRVHAGTLHLHGNDLSRIALPKRAGAGLGYVPQEREVFPSLSVLENLSVAARGGPWTADRVLDLFPRLAERRRAYGNQLSGGEQQMLAIGRALMASPSVLLMDEPSEGLAPVIVAELVEAIERLRETENMTILLVEQKARLALDFAARAVVMDRGRIAFDGASQTLKDDPGQLNRLFGLAG
ncbi:MAG: ABC transporter ATP-binding protein [Alphaproteobacteria bacterium]